jgi:proteasome lid subunit RPN8/RPN11
MIVAAARTSAGEPNVIQVSAEPWECMLDQARLFFPREACGVLIGHERSATVTVTEVLGSANLHERNPESNYILDPKVMLAAELLAKRQHLDVVGVWHSHPDRPPRPSEKDRSRAWPGWSYVIISTTRSGFISASSWRLVADRFKEQKIEL